MPSGNVLQTEVLSGVALQEVLMIVGGIIIVLTVWNRIARARMKLPGGK